MQVRRLQELAREALDELRALIFELRPPDLERDGLAGALRKHVAAQRPLHGTLIELDVDAGAGAGEADAEVLRIAQEALHNALRHAGADTATRPPCRARRLPRSRGRRRRQRALTPRTPSCAPATSG